MKQAKVLHNFWTIQNRRERKIYIGRNISSINMTELISQKQIVTELRAIRQDLDYLKERIVDMDTVMSEEDCFALQEYRKEKKSGNLISHKTLKKELGL